MTSAARHTHPLPLAAVPKYELEFANGSIADADAPLVAARETVDRGRWPELSAEDRHRVRSSAAERNVSRARQSLRQQLQRRQP
jgi:hypothetical protein